MRSSPSPPSRATISSRPCAATSSESSAASTRPARRSSARPRSPATPGSDNCSSVEPRSEEHTSELQSRLHLVCRLLLEKKKKRLTHNLVIDRAEKRRTVHVNKQY